jgi:hypothetical protein
MTQPDMFGRLKELGVLIRGNGRPELLVHIESTLDAMKLPRSPGCKTALALAFQSFADTFNAELRIVNDGDVLVRNNPPDGQAAFNEEHDT